MRLPRRQFLHLAAGVAAVSATSRMTKAQTYPVRRVRIVVPFSAGGATDVAARILGEKLGAAWGKPVVVENRAGGGGNIGAEAVARASPDGHTLLVNVSTHIINASLYQNLNYDPVKDFTPITELVSLPLILVVHPSVPATTLADFVALAKAKPKSVTVANPSIGTPSHLCAILLAQVAGIDVVHVTYKGAAQATTDVVGGHVMAMCNNTVNALPQVRAGTLRALAVASARRLAEMPEVATVAELGYPGFEANAWFGLFAPANVPRDITEKIYADTAQALKMPDVQRNLSAQGLSVVGSTPEEFAAFLSAEHDKWDKLIKNADFRVD